MMKNTLKPHSTMQIDFYKRADDTTPQTTVELVEALEGIQGGAWSAQVNVVRELFPGIAYGPAKQTLAGFTFCGTFRPTRKIVHLAQHNGILLGDLDKRPHVLTDRAAIEADPFTVFCFPESEFTKSRLYQGAAQNSPHVSGINNE